MMDKEIWWKYNCDGFIERMKRKMEMKEVNEGK